MVVNKQNSVKNIWKNANGLGKFLKTPLKLNSTSEVTEVDIAQETVDCDYNTY
jgi:hypothetical protein